MFSRSTKSRTSSLITLLVLASAVSARTLDHRLQCLRTDNHQIIEQTTCGDKGSIAYCLGVLQPTTAHDILVSQLQSCFVNAGCDEAEAEAETLRALSQCDPAEKGREDDLRRRQATTETAAANKPATTAKAGPKTTLVAATTEPAETTEKATTTAEAATTTEATTSAEPTTATTPSTTSSSSRSATTASAAANQVGLAHTGRPLQCFTTTLVPTSSCPIQSTGSRSGQALSCFPTTAPTSVCAAGLICDLDRSGNPSCMYAYNHFDAAGVVVAIFFAVAVTGAAALVITLCCRDRRRQKRAEAIAVAREARVIMGDAKEEDRRLLVGEDGGYAGGAYGGRAGGGQDVAGQGPFGDQHAVR